MTKVVYICAAYPEARGKKWITTFLREGFKPLVLRGRGPKAEVWSQNEKYPVYTFQELDSKIPARAAINPRILDSVKKFKPDVLFVRDIFLMSLGVYLGKRLKLPVYLDMADNYPEVIRSIYPFRPIHGLLSAILNKWEGYVLRRAMGVVFVSYESQQRVYRKHKTYNTEEYVVENVPDLEGSLVKPAAKLQRRRCLQGKLVYIGTLDQGIRDLETVLKGLSIYNKESRKLVSLTLLTFDVDIAHQMVKVIGESSEYVQILPVVDNSILYTTLQEYDFGLVPHARVPATEYTVPNKLFDYLFAGISVICSDNPPLRRILAELGGGITYRCGNPKDFARVLKRVYGHNKAPIPSVNYEILKEKYLWSNQTAAFIERLRMYDSRSSLTT